MKRKKGLIIIISMAAIVLLVGATIAAFVTSTPVQEQVTTTKIKVNIMQNGQEIGEDNQQAGQSEPVQIEYKGFMGGQIDETIGAVNRGDAPCYMRMTVNRSWKDKSGEKVFEVNGKPLKPEDIEIQTGSGNWMMQEDPEDPEVLYYYYRNVVEAGEQTDQLMDSYTLLKDMAENSNHYVGLTPEISFEVDAIQTTAASEAMLAEWGIDAQIAADGAPITGYTEQ